MDDKQPDFRLSSDSLILAKALETINIGETISYGKLSAEIGRDISKFRGALETARKTVQREKRIVFSVIRGEGLIRLNNEQIVDLSDKAREHTRRHARRTMKKLVCVDFAALAKDKQTKHNASLSMFGAITEFASNASQKRLVAKVEEAGIQLPSAKAAMSALGAVFAN